MTCVDDNHIAIFCMNSSVMSMGLLVFLSLPRSRLSLHGAAGERIRARWSSPQRQLSGNSDPGLHHPRVHCGRPVHHPQDDGSLGGDEDTLESW